MNNYESILHKLLFLCKAENYYKQVLEIYIEFDDRYSQAKTFRNLGLLKQEQKNFAEAQNYFTKALEIFRDFNDEHNLIFTLSNLRNLWKISGDDGLIVNVGKVLGWTEAEVREWFETEPDESAGEEGNME